jgi:phosphocarrier protein
MQENQKHAEIEVQICNVQGLHARPVMHFVDIATRFGAKIRVLKNGQGVDGKSPMEMMLLEAGKGTVLKLVADGDDADAALEALAKLINDKFGEE